MEFRSKFDGFFCCKGGEKAAELIPRIPTSYAAALASAATTVATTASINAAVPAEKKKRKPDFPVRKQDSELTETIVPSKKRKFFQLFQWCSTDTATAKKTKKKSGQQRKSSPTTAIKPKIKPKLKGKPKTSSGQMSQLPSLQRRWSMIMSKTQRSWIACAWWRELVSPSFFRATGGKPGQLTNQNVIYTLFLLKSQWRQFQGCSITNEISIETLGRGGITSRVT